LFCVDAVVTKKENTRNKNNCWHVRREGNYSGKFTVSETRAARPLPILDKNKTWVTYSLKRTDR